jgi:hypothetical protein
MQFQLFIVLVMAALAAVVTYLARGRIQPDRWRKIEVEESEAFTIDSVNVLIGPLFSIVLAFAIASLLDDYNKARCDAQQKANAIGAIYGYAQGIPEPAKSSWKTTAVTTQPWSSTKTGR